MISYGKLKYQLLLAVKEDHAADSFFTTVLDYYGLPAGFPGLETVQNTVKPKMVVGNIESALLSEMVSAFPSLQIASMFVPNIMCHEFETLLLSDCAKIAKYYIGYEANMRTLANQVDQVGDPELVNSSPNAAPSKRIISAIPEYDKVTAGAIIAMDVGLGVLRQRCTRFNDWLLRLEAL